MSALQITASPFRGDAEHQKWEIYNARFPASVDPSCLHIPIWHDRQATPNEEHINDYEYEITVDMLDQITDLRVTDGKIEDIVNSEKGGRVAGEALYYLSLDWTNRNFKYEQDHLHPYDRFDGSKPLKVSMEDWRRWRGNRNRLPNLQLLEGRSNGSKNDMRLVDYYNDMNDKQKATFRKQAIIPDGVSLELDSFEEFYDNRKAILVQRIRELLI